MPLSFLHDIVRSIADFLNIESGALTRGFVRIVTIWVGAWLAHRAIRVMARRIIEAVDDGDDTTMTLREKRGQTVAQLLKSMGRVIIVVVAILLTLNVFIEITPILAGAGILGLAVSFGAQSLVKDLIAGFFILLENQFAMGDVIEAAGKAGVVEKMTLRVVQLRDLEGVLHTIPNGEIKVVSNRTRGWARAVVEVGVGYDMDPDRALSVFRDEAARFSADPAWKQRLDGPLEVPGIEALNDSEIVIRTLVRTAPGLQWDAAREYRRRLLVRLRAEQIEIPFAQHTVHVRGLTVAAPEAGAKPESPKPLQDTGAEAKA